MLSFISSMGLPVGSELAIIGGGALATGKVTGQGEPLNLAIVIILATLGEVLGSAAGYAIGRYGGRPLVDRVGKYVLLTHKDLDRAEAWFARRGEPVVFFGRFIPLLRSFVSFAAGLGEMAIGKFLLFTVIACAIWCSALASIGYGLAGTYDQVVKGFSYAGYVLVALAVVAVVVVFWHRYRSYKAEQVQGRHERQA
ncbi:MAG TPA: DedA family protein [Acidimicrobiales bacterium]|nr:DedA family protein [Acidimicrobiales bacterium]